MVVLLLNILLIYNFIFLTIILDILKTYMTSFIKIINDDIYIPKTDVILCYFISQYCFNSSRHYFN